jgi:hypothetical protein
VPLLVEFGTDEGLDDLEDEALHRLYILAGQREKEKGKEANFGVETASDYDWVFLFRFASFTVINPIKPASPISFHHIPSIAFLPSSPFCKFPISTSLQLNPYIPERVLFVVNEYFRQEPSLHY